MSETWNSFWQSFNVLKSDPTVDKCELLDVIEAMRDHVLVKVDRMPTLTTNPIPVIEDCDDVDLRLV